MTVESLTQARLRDMAEYELGESLKEFNNRVVLAVRADPKRLPKLAALIEKAIEDVQEDVQA